MHIYKVASASPRGSRDRIEVRDALTMWRDNKNVRRTIDIRYASRNTRLITFRVAPINIYPTLICYFSASFVTDERFPHLGDMERAPWCALICRRRLCHLSNRHCGAQTFDQYEFSSLCTRDSALGSILHSLNNVS